MERTWTFKRFSHSPSRILPPPQRLNGSSGNAALKVHPIIHPNLNLDHRPCHLLHPPISDHTLLFPLPDEQLYI